MCPQLNCVCSPGTAWQAGRQVPYTVTVTTMAVVSGTLPSHSQKSLQWPPALAFGTLHVMKKWLDRVWNKAQHTVPSICKCEICIPCKTPEQTSGINLTGEEQIEQFGWTFWFVGMKEESNRKHVHYSLTGWLHGLCSHTALWQRGCVPTLPTLPSNRLAIG